MTEENDAKAQIYNEAVQKILDNLDMLEKLTNKKVAVTINKLIAARIDFEKARELINKQ